MNEQEMLKKIKGLEDWRDSAREYIDELEQYHQKWIKANESLKKINEAASELAKQALMAQELVENDVIFRDLIPMKNINAYFNPKQKRTRSKES